jgi:hypothetical protein
VGGWVGVWGCECVGGACVDVRVNGCVWVGGGGCVSRCVCVCVAV